MFKLCDFFKGNLFQNFCKLAGMSSRCSLHNRSYCSYVSWTSLRTQLRGSVTVPWWRFQQTRHGSVQWTARIIDFYVKPVLCCWHHLEVSCTPDLSEMHTAFISKVRRTQVITSTLKMATEYLSETTVKEVTCTRYEHRKTGSTSALITTMAWNQWQYDRFWDTKS